jgi:hypothetical protein
LTDQQLATRNELQDWWINHGWPGAHEGVQYPDFSGGDAAAILKILRSKEIAWDCERGKKLLRFYLRQPEIYGCIGHKLCQVSAQIGHYLTEFKRAEKGLQPKPLNGQSRYPQRQHQPAYLPEGEQDT